MTIDGLVVPGGIVTAASILLVGLVAVVVGGGSGGSVFSPFWTHRAGALLVVGFGAWR